MKNLLYLLLFIPILAQAQVDTLHYSTPYNTYKKWQTDSVVFVEKTRAIAVEATKISVGANIPYSTITGAPANPTATAPIVYASGVISANTATSTISGVMSSTKAYNTLSKSANYTILSSDFANGVPLVLIVFVNDSGGNVTITYPSAITGAQILVVKTNASTNTVTISGITGLNTITDRYQCRSTMNDSTNWYNF